MKSNSDPSFSEELADLPPWDQAFWLSRAFIEGSLYLCENMLDGGFSSQYSSSRVVLHLARQGIELFLKAAIGAATAPKSAPATHDLQLLFLEYQRQYPSLDLAFKIPPIFLVNSDLPLFPEEQYAFHRTLDQRHRYPTDRTGNSFMTRETFDPKETVAELTNLDRELKILETAYIRRIVAGQKPITW
ncbi:hypothetical protein PQQ87_15970 [Paraburkholderia nemoris]|uniref:hypothetical protein n=1 Tax=Paraburkholderia nemoris TaxID=2793076 RepID=UPI0038B87354